MKKSSILLLFCTVLAAWSCLKSDPTAKRTIDPPMDTGEYFDFAAMKACDLEIDYALKGYPAPIDFAVYAGYPFESSGSRRLTNAEPLLRAFADKEGKFSGTIRVPTYLETVYLYTAWYGAADLVELPVSNGTITFSAAPADAVSKAVTRATTPSGRTTPADVYIADNNDWNNAGLLQSSNGVSTIPDGIMPAINGVFQQGVDITDDYPQLLGKVPALNITRTNGINRLKLTFVHSDGTVPYTLCYYTYPTATPPTSPADVRLTVALPSATFKAQGGALATGYSVDLKYWNGGGYVAGFPKGSSIGFCIIKGGFDPSTGNIADGARYYSHPELNEGYQQLVGFAHSDKANFIFGMEASDRAGECDMDFNEMIFIVQTFPGEAGGMSDGAIVDPPAPPDPEPVPTTYKGTLIFEDVWPYQGDFDVNDVVVEYTCTVYLNQDNQVVKTIDSFTPTHNGAKLQNAFAYQYNATPAQVLSMEKTTSWSGRSTAERYRALPWEVDSKGFETGQTLANVLLFDDIRAAGLTSGDQTFNFATVIDKVDKETFGFPPYNPYIVIIYGDEEQGDLRGRELHLATTSGGNPVYRPTDKAAAKWFGWGHDKSVPGEGIFYVSNYNYPFALNLPIHGFKLSPEREKIDTTYPDFHAWALSKGVEFPDWYK